MNRLPLSRESELRRPRRRPRRRGRPSWSARSACASPGPPPTSTSPRHRGSSAQRGRDQRRVPRRLGIAGLVLVQGPDMLWYPVGRHGRLSRSAPVRRGPAAPLRRVHPARLRGGAPRLYRPGATPRRCLRGRGRLAVAAPTTGCRADVGRPDLEAPDWFGGVLVALVVVATVAAGGMRSITFVQAFQTGSSSPPLSVATSSWSSPAGRRRPAPGLRRTRDLREQRVVRIDDSLDLRLSAPLGVTATGQVDGHRDLDGERLRLRAGRPPSSAAPGSTSPRATPSRPPSGAAAAACSPRWRRAARNARCTPRNGLILATFLGTMDRRTSSVDTSPHGVCGPPHHGLVLGLIGAFYLLPPVYGALGRLERPRTEPHRERRRRRPAPARPRDRRALARISWGALVAGGAFAAFLSTASWTPPWR